MYATIGNTLIGLVATMFTLFVIVQYHTDEEHSILNWAIKQPTD